MSILSLLSNSFLAPHSSCYNVTFSSRTSKIIPALPSKSSNLHIKSQNLIIICSQTSMFMAIILSVVLLVAGIGGLILIHICVVGRAFTTGYPNDAVLRFRVPTELIAKRVAGMPRGDIQKLPCFDFTNERSVSLMECAVCLESFKVGEKCRLLPSCSHNFHAKCVDYWLSSTPVCPICRSSVTYPWKVGCVRGGGDVEDVAVEVREVELENAIRNVGSG